MSKVILSKVRKVYEGDVVAIKGLDLEVNDGEFVSLLGPSGCGKSSTLKMIVGLEEITSGEIIIGDRVINNVKTEDRNLSMVFEYYALLPHLNVYDNIAFPLKIKNAKKDAIDKKVKEMAVLFGLEEILYNPTASLSGGQKQQVGVARALMRESEVLLMDEPISHLDMKLRIQARTELARLQRLIGVTTIYVTHDQSESLALADRIAVMNVGELRQYGTPEEIYDYPADTYVAGFIGEYPMNFFDSSLFEENGTLMLAVGSKKLNLPDSIKSRLKDGTEKEVLLGVRPDDIVIHVEDGPGRLPATVKTYEISPEYTILYLDFEGYRFIVRTRKDISDYKQNSEIYLELFSKNFNLFAKKSGKSVLSIPKISELSHK